MESLHEEHGHEHGHEVDVDLAHLPDVGFSHGAYREQDARHGRRLLPDPDSLLKVPDA